MFKKKRIIIGIMIVIIITAVIFAVVQGNVADVRQAAVERGTIQEYAELRGKVDLANRQKVYSKLAGMVDEVKFVEADYVDRGTELLRIDVEDLDIALARAQATYNAAKASLEEVKSSIKPEEVEQAKVQLEQAKIAVEVAQKDYEYKKQQFNKARALYENNAISEKELEDAEMVTVAAEKQLKSAQQTVKAAQYNVDMLKKGVSQSAVEAAQAQAEQARLGVEELEKSIGKASVYSDMQGTILDKYVEKGMAVQPGAPLAEIGEYTSAYIRIDVLVNDATTISIGQKAILSGDVLGDKEIEGEVYYIAPKAESSISSLGVEQQRIEMKIKYDTKMADLKPGYGVDVKMIIQQKEGALYISDKAIFDMDGQDSVFVISDGTLELRSIKTGIENDDYVEVIEGLKEGEQVVIDPENNLKPGMKVK